MGLARVSGWRWEPAERLRERAEGIWAHGFPLPAFLPHFGEGSKAFMPPRGRQQGHSPNPAGTPQCLYQACLCGQDTGPKPAALPVCPWASPAGPLLAPSLCSPHKTSVAPVLLIPKGEVKEGFSGLSKNHQIWVGGVTLSPIQGKPFPPPSGASCLSFQPGPASQRCAPVGPSSSWRPMELMAMGASRVILNESSFNHRCRKKKPIESLNTLEGD